MRRKTLFAALLLGGLASCGDDSSDPVIGVLLPMSGGNATYGEESWNGILIARDEIRRKDPSFAFQLERADEQSSKELAPAQTKKLIENHGAKIVVGSVASSITMAAAIVCKEAGVPLLTPASTNDDLTGKPEQYGASLFRVCFKDSFQGTMLARFARGDDVKAKTAVALVDTASAYSVGLAAQFEAEFTRLGGTVSKENFRATDKDFTTLVQKVGATKPDVVLFSGYYEQGGAMLRIARDAWKGIPVIGGDGLDSPKLFALAGETTSPVYITSHFAAEDSDPVVQEFVKKYRDRFQGVLPGAMAALGYDALYGVYEAWKRSKAAHPSDPWKAANLDAAFHGLEFVGVTGKIRIGDDRTPRKAIVIMKAEGAFKFLRKIQPD